MTKNAGSVHGTIGKALQQIEGDVAANSQHEKCHKFTYCVSRALHRHGAKEAAEASKEEASPLQIIIDQL